MTNLIEARDVRRSYGKGATSYEAVRGIDLHLRKGELLAVLGVNGAGKTSLVEVLEGMAAPSAGEIRVFGKDPFLERHLVRPRVGIMLQEAGFAGDLTVAETLTMWAGTLASPRPVAEALELVDLVDRADVPVKSTSGGERRRLDLALATLGRPELLFLDEPTTGLDPASRERTWETVANMLANGVSILMTTHYLEEAERLADRVMIIADGVVTHTGTVADIVGTRPARISFTADALDSLPAADLAALPGLAGAPDVERRDAVLRTTDLQTTLGALLQLAGAHGVDLDRLDASSASLESAFLDVSRETTAA